MGRAQWIETFAAGLGVSPPAEAAVEPVLALAAEAAHASERAAAPLACWLAAQTAPVSAKRLKWHERCPVALRGSQPTAMSIGKDSSGRHAQTQSRVPQLGGRSRPPGDHG